MAACYVCGGEIRTEPVYIASGVYRHQRCEPGSARYMRNRRLRNRFLKSIGVTWQEWRRRFAGAIREA